MTFKRLFNFLTFNTFCTKETKPLEEEYFLKNNKEKKLEVALVFQCEKRVWVYAEDEHKAHDIAYGKLMDSVDTFSDTEFLSTLPVEITTKNLHTIKNL